MEFNCALCAYSVEVEDDYDYKRVGINHEYDAHTWDICQWCGKAYRPWESFQDSDYCSENCAMENETRVYNDYL